MLRYIGQPISKVASLHSAYYPSIYICQPIFFMSLEAAVQALMLAILMFLLARLFDDVTNRTLWTAIAITCALLPWARPRVHRSQLHSRNDYFALYVLARRITITRYTFCLGCNDRRCSLKAYWSAMRFAQSGGYHQVSPMRFRVLGYERTAVQPKPHTPSGRAMLLGPTHESTQ
jgi:hypothetical protein